MTTEITKEEKQLVRKKQIRVELLRAMNTVCESLNNGEIYVSWLTCGIADGDCASMNDDELFDYYGDDDTFADIMACFCRIMGYALNDTEEYSKEDLRKGNGILFCDKVVSKMKEYN